MKESKYTIKEIENFEQFEKIMNKEIKSINQTYMNESISAFINDSIE